MTAPEPKATRVDALGRLTASLRTRLEAHRAGQPLDAETALVELARLEKLESLLRRTALQGFGEFEHRVKELSLVQRVGSLFSSIFDEQRLCESLIDLVEEAVPCTHAFLFLHPRGVDDLKLMALVGPELEEADRGVADRAAAVCMAGSASGSGFVPIWVADASEHSELGQQARGSLLACPLVAQGQSLGAIVASEPSPGVLRESHGRILAPLADLAALAVRHARVCAENLDSHRHLEHIVEQRTREVNEARAMLSRQERVSAMGKLAASIAHEVNNPMSFLVSNLERAHEYVADIQQALPGFIELLAAARSLPQSSDPRIGRTRDLARRQSVSEPSQRLATVAAEFSELIDEAREGTDRIQRVGHDLRSFAQGVAGVMEPADINRLVDTALHIARAESKPDLLFECHLGVLPEVRCQRYQITQILLNLFQNAVEAVSPGGVVRITTRVAGTCVEVEVADDGPGVDASQLGRVFEPFYTTKQDGSGLGLPISRDIATLHRGSLEAQSSPEGGVFVLRLPIGGPAGGAGT